MEQVQEAAREVQEMVEDKEKVEQAEVELEKKQAERKEAVSSFF